MQAQVKKLEAEATTTAKELSRLEHKGRDSERRYRQLKAKTDKIICKMAEKMLTSVDELQEELSKCKQDVRHI